MRTGLTPVQWLMVVLVGMLVGGIILFAVYSGAIDGLTDIVNRSADQATDQGEGPLGSSFPGDIAPERADSRSTLPGTGPSPRAGVV